jgi:hypothetical protein
MARELHVTASSDISLKVIQMRRRTLLLLIIVLLLTGSATGVRASTDCQRWFAAYKQQLEHSQAVNRLRRAKLRAQRYARMKLAGYVKPKPQPHHYRPRHPRMTRAEMLRRYNLACGVLPEREVEPQTISEEIPPDFTSHRPFSFVPASDEGDQQLIATNDLPPYIGPEQNWPGSTPDGPPSYTPPGGGFPGFPGGGPPPHSSSNPPPVITAVPEPESLVLLLTGLIGGAGLLRRKLKC